MWEELVVKRYLCAKTAGLLTLEYYLLISLFAEDLEIYGVKIVEWQNSNQRPGLTMSGQQIFRPIALLSKGTVVPTSLVVEFIGLSFALPGDGGPSMSVERGVSLTIYISTYSFSLSE